MELINLLGDNKIENGRNSIIDKGLEYLQINFAKNPSVDELAKLCSVSEEYFRTKFKDATKTTPCKYKNMLRMSKALDYIIYENMGIEEISELLGYATVSHFIKEFKKYYGTSPNQYKKIKLQAFN